MLLDKVKLTKHLLVCDHAGGGVWRGTSETEPVVRRPLGRRVQVSSSAGGGGGALRRQTEAEDPTGDGAALLRALPR